MTTSISTRTPGSLNPTRQQLDELDALLKRMLELPVNQLDEGNEAETEAEDAADEPPPPPPPVERSAATEPVAPSVSYMVIETASPRPLPPASGFEPRPSPLTPMTPPANVTTEESEPPADVELAPTIAVEAPASEAEAWVPLRSTWQPSAQTWQPLAESWRQANGTAATPAAVPETVPSSQLNPAPPVGPASRRSEPMTGETPVPPTPPTEPMTGETPVPPTPPAEPSPAVAEPAEPRLSLTAEDAPAEPRWLLPLLWFNQGFDACMAPLGAFGSWLCGPSGRQMLGIAGLACLVAAVAVAVSVGMAWTW